MNQIVELGYEIALVAVSVGILWFAVRVVLNLYKGQA